MRSSKIAPFKFIEPLIDAFSKITLSVWIKASSLLCISETAWLLCPSMDVAGSNTSSSSKDVVWIGWVGNNNWKKIESNCLVLSVHDDGPGIHESQYDEVMQPFTRLDPSRNQNKGSGVGLGLPIAKEIAEGQGGTLKLSKSDILAGLSASLIIPINI